MKVIIRTRYAEPSTKADLTVRKGGKNAMKKTGKRILSYLLCAAMFISQMSTAVFAQETEESAETFEETVTIEYTAEDDDLPDNDELFAYFVEEQLYDYEASTFGTQYRNKLNDVEQAIYDVLREKITYVALIGGSTDFAVSKASGLKTTWICCSQFWRLGSPKSRHQQI